MKYLIRWISLINERIAIYGCGAALFALVIITALNVVLRYIFKSPFAFIIELDEDLLLVMAFLVGGYTMSLDAHVRVDILFHRLSEKQRAIQEVITYPLVMVFFVVLTWYGFDMTYEAWEIKATSPGMDWPNWPVYAFVPLGGILIGLQALAMFLKALLRLVDGFGEQ
jgi:TRAP-type C4-dicarboxylate transport system permease small subunit